MLQLFLRSLLFFGQKFTFDKRFLHRELETRVLYLGWMRWQFFCIIEEKRSCVTYNIVLKRESWTTAVSLTEYRAKGSPPKKATLDKRELLTLALGGACRWEKLKLMNICWVRTSQANHKSMWQATQCLYLQGGLGSHTTPVTWYGNRQSMQHSGWVIRTTRHTARKFIF